MRAPNLVAFLTLLAVLAAAAAPGGAQQPTSKNPVELYTEAKFQEESRGAVDRAIELYRQVLNHPAASASLKAQALYREGLCQVRKDDFTAARAAFERLLKEHPRTEPAAHAKLMLKTLGASKSGMAAPRDISIEVKDQLIRGNKSSKDQSAALRALVFYGNAARPALREALLVQDRGVQMLALNALARMGDPEVLDRLVEAAGGAAWRSTHYGLSNFGALVSFCDAHKVGVPRVTKAYREADPGAKKANLMRLLLDLKRLEEIGDYRSFLVSENPDMRSAAWYAYSRIAFGKDGRADAFLVDLLEAWNAHPDRQAELSRYLFKTGREAVKRDPTLAGPWQKTLLAAAASEDLGIVREVARGLGYLDLGHQLPIRTALLASPDRKVREQAAELRWKPSHPRPELDPAQLRNFTNALVETAAKYCAREEQHSTTLLRALTQKVVPLLDRAALAALADRLFTPPLSDVFRVDGPLNQQGVVGQTIQQIFSLSNIQGAYAYQDRYHSLAEKYVPVLTAYAAPGKPRAARMRCFQSLQQVVQHAWSFLPKAEQEDIKKVYFAAFDEYRAGHLSWAFSRQLQHSLYNGLICLAQQRPRVVTVDELLRHAPLLARVGPTGGGTLYGQRIFTAFSPQELRGGFLRGAADAQVRVASLLELLGSIELEPEKRDAALRELWTRADPDERARIAGQLAKTGRNLKFLTEAIRPETDEAEAKAIQRALDDWGSREAAHGLIKLLDVRSDAVKIVACGSLGSLADPRAVPKLIELLAYHNGPVRRAAESALTAIRDIDKKQAEWRDWYEHQGKQGAPKKPTPKPTKDR